MTIIRLKKRALRITAAALSEPGWYPDAPLKIKRRIGGRGWGIFVTPRWGIS
jgi:hypothetical protein